MNIRITQLSLFDELAPAMLGGGTYLQYGPRKAPEG